MQTIGVVLLVLGGLVSVINFYLSVLRYPINLLLKRPYKWISGFPIIGSVMLVVAALIMRSNPLLFWMAVGLAIIDTGGIHWFIGTIIWMHRKENQSELQNHGE